MSPAGCEVFLEHRAIALIKNEQASIKVEHLLMLIVKCLAR